MAEPISQSEFHLSEFYQLYIGMYELRSYQVGKEKYSPKKQENTTLKNPVESIFLGAIYTYNHEHQLNF